MLISQKQHEANRRNALRSTGPVTTEGKAAVRFNALRHGLRARAVLLPGENAEEFHQLCADLESDWNAQTRTEQLLVEQMAVAQWKLARLEVGERSIFIKDMPAGQQMALLDRFSAQRGRLERSFSKAMHELQRLQREQNLAPRRQLSVLSGCGPQNPAPCPPAPAPGGRDGLWPALSPLVMAPAQAPMAP